MKSKGILLSSLFILVGCNTNNETNTTNKYDLNIEYNYEHGVVSG